VIVVIVVHLTDIFHVVEHVLKPLDAAFVQPSWFLRWAFGSVVVIVTVKESSSSLHPS